MNHKWITDEERELVIRLYQAGKRPAEIAEICHIAKSSVNSIRKEAGIPPRKGGFRETQKPRTVQGGEKIRAFDEKIDVKDDVAYAIAHIQHGLDVLRKYHEKADGRDLFIHTVWEALDKLTSPAREGKGCGNEEAKE